MLIFSTNNILLEQLYLQVVLLKFLIHLFFDFVENTSQMLPVEYKTPYLTSLKSVLENILTKLRFL